MKINLLDKLFRILFIFLLLGLWYLQIIKGPYFNHMSAKNRIRILPLKPQRGDILDRRGNVIATKQMSFDVTVVPQELTNEKSVFRELSSTLKIPADELKLRYHNNLSAPSLPVTLVENINLDKVFVLEEKKPNLKGVEIQTNYLRVYPYNNTAAHLLGYLSEINLQELERLRPYGYGIRNLVGKSGIERTLDVYLRGKAGGKQIEVDNRGNLIRILGEKQPKAGEDVKLTIDINWQNKAHKLLSGYNGAILIMDIKNGEILVLESSPSFNPNLFISGKEREIQTLLSSKNSPLLNRAVRANFPPGSIFKLVAAISGLETKKIDNSKEYRCDGKLFIGNREFGCWEGKGHGNQTVIEAIQHSCNVFFYKLGLALGPDNIRNYANILGLGDNPGIELSEVSKGLVPNPAWKYSAHKERWFDGDTLNLSIGQGFVLTSPLQILRLVASIGNGGFLVRPRLVKKIGSTAIQDVRKEYTGIKNENIKIIQEGMFQAVDSIDGTGRRAKVEGLEIAAKTATAQVTREMTHAWIAGFLPYSNPQLCFVIFLEHGGKGGIEAADICRELFTGIKEEILRYTNEP